MRIRWFWKFLSLMKLVVLLSRAALMWLLVSHLASIDTTMIVDLNNPETLAGW